MPLLETMPFKDAEEYLTSYDRKMFLEYNSITEEGNIYYTLNKDFALFIVAETNIDTIIREHFYFFLCFNEKELEKLKGLENDFMEYVKNEVGRLITTYRISPKEEVLNVMTFKEAKEFLTPAEYLKLEKEDSEIIYYTESSDFMNYILYEVEDRAISTYRVIPNAISFFFPKSELEVRKLQTYSLRFLMDEPFVEIDGKLYFRSKYNDFIKRFNDLYPETSWSEEKGRYRYPKENKIGFNSSLFRLRYQYYLLVLENK